MNRPYSRMRAGVLGVALPLSLAVAACAPTAQPAPTTAPTAAAAKPTEASKPTAPPAAAASPVAPAAAPATTAPVASPVAKPAASPAAMASPSPMAMVTGNSVQSIKGAEDLRTALNNLLQEHVYLAGTATGAALGGRDAEFKAAADTLDRNSVELSKLIGAAYGTPAEQTFLELWRKHIGFFVDYTQGLAANDTAKKQKAMSDLDGYRRDFDAFITGANPNLPKGAVAELLTPHVMMLESAIDAQAAKDPVKAFMQLKATADQAQNIGDPLAAAIAKQFPEKFPGQPTSKAADLQSGLNMLLAEHEYLAGSATGAALGGRDAEFKAAADTLDMNTVALGKTIGAAYGAPAEQTFLQLWRTHIGFFVDYTQGLAANDTAKKQKAMSDLDGYRRDFDAFITGANPNLPKGAVAELLTTHVRETLSAIDAQGAKDPAKAFSSLKAAADHMRVIGDALAGAVAKQFPEKFPAR